MLACGRCSVRLVRITRALQRLRLQSPCGGCACSRPGGGYACSRPGGGCACSRPGGGCACSRAGRGCAWYRLAVAAAGAGTAAAGAGTAAAGAGTAAAGAGTAAAGAGTAAAAASTAAAGARTVAAAPRAVSLNLTRRRPFNAYLPALLWVRLLPMMRAQELVHALSRRRPLRSSRTVRAARPGYQLRPVAR